MTFLRVDLSLEESTKKQFFPMPKKDTNSLIIGRTPGADGLLVNDKWTNPQGDVGSRISKIHLVLTSKVNGTFTVKDTSLTGTWIKRFGNRGKYFKLEEHADTTLVHGDVLFLISPHVAGFCPQHCILECVHNVKAPAMLCSVRQQKGSSFAPMKKKV